MNEYAGWSIHDKTGIFSALADDEVKRLHDKLHSAWNASGYTSTANDIEQLMIDLEDEAEDRGWEIK